MLDKGVIAGQTSIKPSETKKKGPGTQNCA